MSRSRVTAVGRLTAWFALLFAVVSILNTAASYALVGSAFDNRPPVTAETFIKFGLPVPTPEAIVQLQQSAGVDLALLLKRAGDRSRQDALSGLAKRSAALLPVMILLAALGAWWLSGKAFQPVRRLTGLANGISATNLHDRIDLVGPPDELKALADTFDAMLNRLEGAFRSQRLFAAYASHELRTPLAVLLAEADAIDARPDTTDAERRLVTATRRAVERTDLMTSSLLALSRAESGMTDRSTVQLADVAGDVTSDLVALANDAQITLDLSLDDANVTGDPVLLRSLLDNLIRNAIQYNHPGGTASITVTTTDGHAVVRAENTGNLLTPQDIAAYSEPFARGDGARRIAGSGIGGAVITSVAAAHGATLHATARAGGGLTVVITFP
jgi:signal transduction histidine kinase